MSTMMDVKRPDGQSCPAYLSEPAGSSGAPGFVVIQEWWGLNPQIKGIADRLAGEGFRALVPDLYRGKVASSADEASHMMSSLDFVGAATQDVRGCIQQLEASGSAKVAVGGFCMGGALTLLCGMHVAEMDAGVCFYGIPPAEAGEPGSIKVPLQCHFATHDDWCTPDSVDTLERKLRAGGVTFELHRYDAKHGFMNEKRPEVHDPASAKVAWDRMLAFLRKNL